MSAPSRREAEEQRHLESILRSGLNEIDADTDEPSFPPAHHPSPGIMSDETLRLIADATSNTDLEEPMPLISEDEIYQRLQCLRLAVSANLGADTVSAARAYFEFITGQAEAGASDQTEAA